VRITISVIRRISARSAAPTPLRGRRFLVSRVRPRGGARTQRNFPAAGEIPAPFSIGHFVAGCMRGSHTAPPIPVPLRHDLLF
jgi:hypothetical protein